MTDTQYQLNSVLPFDVSEHDGDVQRMLNSAPAHIWKGINAADGHEATVKAYDRLGNWIALNYKRFFSAFA